MHPESTFKDRVRTAAYPVQAKAGLLWAYLGPAPAPLLPDWAGFYSPGYTVVSLLHVPCHWLQIMEGFYDPVHVEWLHDRWSFHLHGRAVPARRPRHTAFRWLDFEYGVIFQRKLAGSDEWLADRTVVFPNLDGAAGQGWYLTWVVPVDDTHTILVYRLTLTSWKTPLGQVMVPANRRVQQTRVPAYRAQASLDAEAGPPEHFGSHLVSQDYASWLGPGAAGRPHAREPRRDGPGHPDVPTEAARAGARGGGGRRSAGRDPRPEGQPQDHAAGRAQGLRDSRRGAARAHRRGRRDVPRLPPRRDSAGDPAGSRAGDVRAGRGTAARLVEAPRRLTGSRGTHRLGVPRAECGVVAANVREMLRSFILSSFLPGEEPETLDDSTLLVSSGVITSLSLLELVTFIEDRFSVALEGDDLGIARMDSIDSMVELIRERSGSELRRVAD